MNFSNAICKRAGALLLAFAATSFATADDEAWEKVQHILSSTSDMVMLDGTESIPLESARPSRPSSNVRPQRDRPSPCSGARCTWSKIPPGSRRGIAARGRL